MRHASKKTVLQSLLLVALTAPSTVLAQEAPGGHRAGAATLTGTVEQVREANDRFQKLATALTEGWTDQYPEGCAVSADGAQAFHFLNPSLVDAEIDLLTPELLMYEPRPDGSMELIGADYIIPFDQWEGSEPPSLVGRPLMRNEALGVWAIHVWAWRDNPSGLFAPWNPHVSCEHAG